MGIIKKFSDLVSSNLNHWLNHAEDPQKLAELAILESKKKQQKAQDMLISAMGALNLADARLKSLGRELSELLQEAKDMLANHNEEQAKKILKEKQSLEQDIAQAKQEKSLHEQTVHTLNRGLQALDNQINHLKASAASGPDHVHNTDAFETFERMAEKVESQEAETQALEELFRLSEKMDNDANKVIIPPVPKATRTLTLEEELEELKKKL